MKEERDAKELDIVEHRNKDLKGSVFIIPLDSPIPGELAEATLPTGSLLSRLQPLNTEIADPFGLVPLTGSELLALDKAFSYLQVSKQVYALKGIPGAEYDMYFTQAIRVIGLRTMDWDEVSAALESAVRTAQRLGDKTPWMVEDPATKKAELRPRRVNSTSVDTHLPTPRIDSGDDSDNGAEAGDMGEN
jgi:hypothetical protein